MPLSERRALLARRQEGQRLGSFVKPLEWKNSCSPALKVKLVLQSEHWIDLS